MKAPLLAVLLVAAAASGCAGGEGNPNLAAPKLVLQVRPDGNVTVFIHSAFGERLYEWISLAVDNVTVENRTGAFSLESSFASDGFYADAAAGTLRETYTLRARLDVDALDAQVVASFHRDDGEWSQPETFTLPFERVLNRRASP